ncbi:MAG: SLC13 family permease [Candidatus Promineifilaceae bacterium]|nr:SLC13 family permease [Candidatus Promineifilaceae bacterium]
MTPSIALTFLILAAAVVLFVTERLRVDLIALLVLGTLAATGLVTPAEALSGFSNPAVVTVWAVFILSAGLSRTGVANVVGRHVLRLAGEGELRLLVVIMVTAGVMSGFMNNVGVVALLLPVVMDIAGRTGRAPSRLLIPLSFGALLGGLTTLIGTPPNILVSDALRDAGFQPFAFFDFTPVGGVVAFAGILFIALAGRHLLPVRDTRHDWRQDDDSLGELYDLEERLFVLQLPQETPLAGKTLVDSRIGVALGLNVVGIIRDGQTNLAPGPETVLHGGDRLLVAGAADRLAELGERDVVIVADESLSVSTLTSGQIQLAEVTLAPGSAYHGQTLHQIDFRARYGANVLAIWREGSVRRTDLQDVPVRRGDTMLVQGTDEQLKRLAGSPDFLVSSAGTSSLYRLHERLVALRVPPGSPLAGKSLVESRLGDAFDLLVLGIVRDGETILMPPPTAELQAGDTLIVEGRLQDLAILHGLQELEVDARARPDVDELESARVGMVEAVLSPHTTLVGKSLRDLFFREKYQLNVLAVWRAGRAYRTGLRDMELRFGDTLLLFGPWEKLHLLSRDPDLLVLTEELQEPVRLEKAPLAALIMLGFIVAVAAGLLPIAVGAVIAATLMVVTGCLDMEEAYRHIQWPAVFLIAGMLPLGIAMSSSGAAQFAAEGVISAVGALGPLAIVAGLFLLTSLASQIMPNPVVVVLMAPIALTTAADLGLSPTALLIAIAVAAGASFLSPVGHPANVLIMGPGGYRFSDYLRVGLPLTLVVFLVTLLVLPFVWPLTP